jgi:hypothetical protein
MTADVQFDVVWRFEKTGFSMALPFEADAAGAAVPAFPGDLLVLRVTVVQSEKAGSAYVLNGDGKTAGGRIPSLRLP